MNIRKLYMAVFGILMSAQITYAQQNMAIVDNMGKVNVVSVSSVDYATFNANSKWFSITNNGIEAATTTSISASCTIGLAADSDVKELTITPIVGVCYSKYNATPTIDDNCDSLGSQLKNYTFTISPLIPGTTYHYRIYVKLADKVFYGDVDKAKTLGTKPIDFAITNDSIETVTTTSFSASCTVGVADDSDVKDLTTTPQVGVCYSTDNTTPTISDDCDSLGTQLKSYTFSLSSLLSGTTYYYRIYVKLADKIFYGDVNNVKTLDIAPVDNSQTINGHKFVDLGLPSGLLWAETNIGAENAADDGNYYAWGETEPHSSNSYSWSSYKHGTSSFNLTKYNSSDNKTTIDKEDDAAYVNCGSPCRMPTKYEFTELCDSNNCTWTWTSMANSDGSSVYGCKVTSVKNGNSIFLPASGYCSYDGHHGHGSEGAYWSSTLNSSTFCYAYRLYFSSNLHYYHLYSYRLYGFPIRPVAEP